MEKICTIWEVVLRWEIWNWRGEILRKLIDIEAVEGRVQEIYGEAESQFSKIRNLINR